MPSSRGGAVLDRVGTRPHRTACGLTGKPSAPDVLGTGPADVVLARHRDLMRSPHSRHSSSHPADAAGHLARAGATIAAAPTSSWSCPGRPSISKLPETVRALRGLSSPRPSSHSFGHAMERACGAGGSRFLSSPCSRTPSAEGRLLASPVSVAERLVAEAALQVALLLASPSPRVTGPAWRGWHSLPLARLYNLPSQAECTIWTRRPQVGRR